MAEVKVPILVENAVDRERQVVGELPEDRVRSTQVDALVDTGATMLMLPEDVVDYLGLRERGKVIVTYADERREERRCAGIVTVRVGDRQTDLDCIIGPPNSEPLLGHIVLEATDLLVDPSGEKLIPRPESPYLPLMKMKRGRV